MNPMLEHPPLKIIIPAIRVIYSIFVANVLQTEILEILEFIADQNKYMNITYY